MKFLTLLFLHCFFGIVFSLMYPNTTTLTINESNNNILKNDSWTLLGKSTIEPSDNGITSIKILTAKKIKSLRFMVKKGGLNIRRCEAWLNDSNKKIIELRNDIATGEESRIIEISNNPMELEKILITYDTRNHEAVPTQLELWGKNE